jgi:hydroxyacyl-ACP dehydratase HTD2-like protein with hotdog domain
LLACAARARRKRSGVHGAPRSVSIFIVNYNCLSPIIIITTRVSPTNTTTTLIMFSIQDTRRSPNPPMCLRRYLWASEANPGLHLHRRPWWLTNAVTCTSCNRVSAVSSRDCRTSSRCAVTVGRRPSQNASTPYFDAHTLYHTRTLQAYPPSFYV